MGEAREYRVSNSQQAGATLPIDVENVIGGLKFSLDSLVPEEKLLQVIIDRMTALRRSFPSQSSFFSPSHMEFLKKMASISHALVSFIELKDELADVDTLEEYTAMAGRLVRIKDTLAPFAVGMRVMKEIRELNEKLPNIRERDNANRNFRVSTRILDLEGNPPKYCPRKHAMVIRGGSEGYFWGCGKYPFCRETAQLTPEQKARLLI